MDANTNLLDQSVAQTEAATKAANPFKLGNIHAGSTDGTVSSQWFARPADQRFPDLGTMRNYAKARFDASRQLVVNNRDLTFIAPNPAEYTKPTDKHVLSIGLPDGSITTPTHWSFGQLCQRAGAPARYLRKHPSFLAAMELTVDFRLNREVESVKAFFQPDGSAELHAITGPDYGRIPDFEVIEAVQQFAGLGIGDQAWKMPGTINWSTKEYDPENMDSTFFASDRDCFLFLVDDRNPIEVGKTADGGPDYMFRGFYVSNSEVGNRSLTVSTFYLRGVCMNRMLWGVEQQTKINLRHSKTAPDRFMMTVLPALEAFTSGTAQGLVDGVEMAKAAKLAKDDEDAMDWLKNAGFGTQIADAMLNLHLAEEGRPVRSAWDMANAITAHARNIQMQDERLQEELVAGRLLDKVTATPMGQAIEFDALAA